MYCNKCGTELVEGAVFCSKCGAKQEALLIPKPEETTKESVSNPSRSIKKGKPVYLIASVALMVLVLCVAFICSSLGNKVNLNNYVTVTYDGYNGYGTASINFDEEAFTKKYGNKITMNGDLKVASFFLGASPSYALFSSAGYSLSKDSDLKNGDTITLTYSSDSTPEEFKKYYGLTVVCKEETLTVADLMEPEKFDAFEKVYVAFSGLSGSGKASIECKDDVFNKYNYEIFPQMDLKNGDEVTVTLSLDGNKLTDYVKKYGKVPESLNKSYTVEGLDKYVESVSEISTDSMEQLSALAESEFSRHVRVEGESLENFTVLKYYLLTQDPDTDIYLTAENVLYVICKAKVHNFCHNDEKDKHFDQTTDIYYFLETENLILSPDGTLNIQQYTRSPSHNVRVSAPFFDLSHTTSWLYPGFSSLEELEVALSSSFTLPWEGYNVEEISDIQSSPQPEFQETADRGDFLFDDFCGFANLQYHDGIYFYSEMGEDIEAENLSYISSDLIKYDPQTGQTTVYLKNIGDYYIYDDVLYCIVGRYEDIPTTLYAENLVTGELVDDLSMGGLSDYGTAYMRFYPDKIMVACYVPYLDIIDGDSYMEINLLGSDNSFCNLIEGDHIDLDPDLRWKSPVPGYLSDDVAAKIRAFIPNDLVPALQEFTGVDSVIPLPDVIASDVFGFTDTKYDTKTGEFSMRLKLVDAHTFAQKDFAMSGLVGIANGKICIYDKDGKLIFLDASDID